MLFRIHQLSQLKTNEYILNKINDFKLTLIISYIIKRLINEFQYNRTFNWNSYHSKELIDLI